jgi:Flp pilus assembly protein TadD
MITWFNAREAVAAGTALADSFPAQATQQDAVRKFLQNAAGELRSLKLNVYKRARFANAFKWRLLEKGVQADVASEVTQTLLISSFGASPAVASPRPAAPASPAIAAAAATGTPEGLYARAAKAQKAGDNAEAAEHLRAYLTHRPRDAEALNNLGAALIELCDFVGAQEQLRKAVSARAKYPAAQTNLGIAHLAQAKYAEAEAALRRALTLQASYATARANLGLVLALTGRLEEAKGEIDKVLRAAPRDSDALYASGMVAMSEGRFTEAEEIFKRSLTENPKHARTWSALAGSRKMTSADKEWLNRGEKHLASILPPMQEAHLRFAVGKFYDDTQEYAKAFANYERGNQVLKSIAPKYEHAQRTGFVDDMIRVYTPEAIARAQSEGGSDSTKPLLLVGMMRSGTALAEQILASHPAVAGAGELEFWSNAAAKHDSELRSSLLGGAVRKKLADEYLRTLTSHYPDAQHVVDKAPLNADYLGTFHSIFPRAKIIYLRRDPVDTGLSCYFQPFSGGYSWSYELADIAAYYQEHARLLAHWRKVLPRDSFLEVPYEELVSNQVQWTRKMLDFLGLGWDEHCLQFHKTERPVVTASRWQVRQPLYNDSIQRARHYSKYIGPLREASRA